MADDPVSQLTGYLPTWSQIQAGGLSAVNVLTIIILCLIIFTILGVLTYLFLQKLKYKHRIVIWEKIGNHWERTGYDRAMEMKFGIAGDTVFVLRKRKKYLPRPETQTGRREFWFAIREDGEWINIGMEDIDLAQKQAHVNFLHPEVRYARTSMQKAMREEYIKPKFMEKYGHIIIPFAGFALIGIFLWLMMDKFLTLAGTLNGIVEKLPPLLERADTIIANLARISSGSGYTTGG